MFFSQIVLLRGVWSDSYLPHTLQGKSSFVIIAIEVPDVICPLLVAFACVTFEFRPMQWMRVCPCKAAFDVKL